MTTHASDVPATPVFVIEYPAEGAATVDGTPVYVPEGAEARHAAIDEVRFTASLLDRPVRAIDVDPNGTRYPLLVDPDGTLTFLAEPHPDPDPDPDVPDREVHTPSSEEGAASTTPTTPTDDHDSAFGEWWARIDEEHPPGQATDGHVGDEHGPHETPDPPEAAQPPAEGAPSTTPARPDRARRRASRSGPRVTPVAIGLAVAAAVTVVAVLVWPDDESAGSRTSTASRAEPAAVAAPAGWRGTSAWSRSIAPPGAGRPSVAALGSVLAILTPDRRVALLDPHDGRIDWAGEPLPAGNLALHATGDTAAPVLVAETEGGLLVWPPLRAPRPARPPTAVRFAPGAHISYAGTLPLVTGPNGSAAALRGEALVPVRLSPGTVAMAADTAHVLAGRAVGPWELLGFDGRTRVVTPLPPRPGARILRMAGGGQGVVAVVWSGPGDGSETLAVHDASSGRVLAGADAPIGSLSSAWIHPSGDPLAALGPVVVDLAEGRASVTPGVVARSVAGGRVYGTRDLHPVALTVTGVVTVPDGAAIPWGVSAGRAILLTGDGDRAVVHAVDPAP
ncbi:hypothetical protein B4N89_36950 [Embleya scabrispora]|uniref:Uncharacterized protein n=1 Tax=Embleya scabrispora TaxID=159449 RepID=A0A1T3NMD2_9ACTN|nr:hypothetical protein [Embleya scabrispora]OPC77855.1 hypothetical protein B4N89_36950 [Embleya scabrispora]